MSRNVDHPSLFASLPHIIVNVHNVAGDGILQREYEFCARLRDVAQDIAPSWQALVEEVGLCVDEIKIWPEPEFPEGFRVGDPCQ